MNGPLDGQALRSLACLLTAAGLCVSSLEWLVPWNKLAPHGIVAPHLPGAEPGAFVGRVRPHGLRTVLILRFVCAFAALTGFSSGVSPWLAGTALLCAGLLSLILRLDEPLGVYVGMDGAEQIMTSTSLVLGASFVVGSQLALHAALAFVALQALLEYASAGLTKLLVLRDWASGTHLLRVLGHNSYGHPWLFARALAHPRVAGALALSVVALEVLSPLALVLPSPGAELLLAGLLAFHQGSAAIMGLNTFPWAFAATYPAVVHVRDTLLGLV